MKVKRAPASARFAWGPGEVNGEGIAYVAGTVFGSRMTICASQAVVTSLVNVAKIGPLIGICLSSVMLPARWGSLNKFIPDSRLARTWKQAGGEHGSVTFPVTGPTLAIRLSPEADAVLVVVQVLRALILVRADRLFADERPVEGRRHLNSPPPLAIALYQSSCRYPASPVVPSVGPMAR